MRYVIDAIFHKISVVGLLAIDEESSIKPAKFDWYAAFLNPVLIEHGSKAAVSCGRMALCQQQGGNNVEAGIVDSIDSGIQMFLGEEEACLFEGLARALNTVADQFLASRSQTITPSRSMFSCNGRVLKCG